MRSDIEGVKVKKCSKTKWYGLKVATTSIKLSPTPRATLAVWLSGWVGRPFVGSVMCNKAAALKRMVLCSISSRIPNSVQKTLTMQRVRLKLIAIWKWLRRSNSDLIQWSRNNPSRINQDCLTAVAPSLSLCFERNKTFSGMLVGFRCTCTYVF